MDEKDDFDGKVPDVSGKWLSNGRTDSPRAIFQAGRVLVLATVHPSSKDISNSLGVGLFTDESHISVPLWGFQTESVTTTKIEWAHGETWTRPRN
jgi:hypothetical protein